LWGAVKWQLKVNRRAPQEIAGLPKTNSKEEEKNRMQVFQHPVTFYWGLCVGLVPHHEQTGWSNMVLHCTAFEQRLASIRGG
jgi:hypothetical protein